MKEDDVAVLRLVVGEKTVKKMRRKMRGKER